MLEERVAKIESDVEHLKTDVEHLKTDVRELRTDFHSFKVEVTREFGALKAQIEWVRTAIEQSKRWMLLTGLGLLATSAGTLATLGRIMRWF